MPTYSGSGTEPLGSDPQTYDATTDGEEKDLGDLRGGKNAGGDETNAVTLSGGSKSTPGGSASSPKGVQTFDGSAT